MKTRFFTVAATILTVTSGFAGAAIFTGRVVDNKKEPVIGATVKVVSLPDSTLLSISGTDINGLYSLDSVPEGRHALISEFYGMTTAPMVLRVEESNDTIELPDIQMHDSNTMLADVVVTGYKSAVTARQDTLEFNAGSFKTRENAVVEDLLRKLPGVDVGSDGSITSNGKSIKKILVDGEEFFSDDPKMASKNLPADMVEKVQVIDRKSDMARITGIDDGEEETVINLTIKKNRKNGWFGNVQAGYGTLKRYNLGFNINRFNNGNQYTFLGSLNNVNDYTFTDNGRGRFRGGAGSNDGITRIGSLGFNFAVGSSENLRIGGNVLYSNTDQDYNKRSARQYLFPDSTSYENSESWSRNIGHNVRADLRLQWKIDENNNLDFRPRFSYNYRDVEQNDTSRTYNDMMKIVNSQDNFQNNTGNSYDFSGDLIYSHKFSIRPGRQASAQVNYKFSDMREKGTTWSEIMYYLLQDDSEKYFRYIDNHQWSNSVEGRFTWTEPLGNVANGNFLNFSYRMKYNFNNADKLTYNVPTELFEDPMTAQLFNSLKIGSDDGVIDTGLSNRFRNNFFTQELQVSYKKVNSKYNLETGLVFVPSMSKSTDLIDSNKDIPTRWAWNVAPFLRFRYSFNKTKYLRINYRARTAEPSMKQLQPVADESDPLNIVIGNPLLKPTFSQTLNFNYADFDSESQSALMVMANASHSLNSIVTKSTNDPITGGRRMEYVNVDNQWSMMGGAMYNRPIDKAHWRITGELFANMSSSPGYINGVMNRATNLNVRPRVGITYSNDILQISASPQYSFQYTHNTLPKQANRNVNSWGVYGYATLYLPFGLGLSTDIDWSKTSGYSNGFNSNQALWNAEMTYSLLKSKSLTLGIKVYDILQQKNAISRNVTSMYISDERVNCLTRYAMFTVTYKFQTYSATKNREYGGFDGDVPPPPGAGHDGPPPGPPPGGAGGPPPGGGPPPF